MADMNRPIFINGVLGFETATLTEITASGAVETITWDGQNESTQLTFPVGDPVVQVEVDPERKLMAEFDIADNSLSSDVAVGPAVILGGHLMFWLQLLVSLVGLIG